MKKDWMTGRERIEAALEGRERDRLCFSAKVSSWPEEPFSQKTRREILDYIGSDPVNLFSVRFHYKNPKVNIQYKETKTARIWEHGTPDGILTEREELDEASGTWHPVEFPIKSLNDIKAARYIYDHAQYEVDSTDLQRHCDIVQGHEDEFFCISNPPSPLMELVEYKMGIINLSYFIMDYPDEIEELIELMRQSHLRLLGKIIQHTPRPYIRTVENTSTTLISPMMFKKVAFPHLCEYGRLIEENGMKHILHMCGHIKQLLPLIDRIPACAIEAFQATPMGDTNLADGVHLCPNKALIGGIAGTLWSLPDQEIVKRITADLEAAGNIRRICLENAGGMLTSIHPDRMKYIWSNILNHFCG